VAAVGPAAAVLGGGGGSINGMKIGMMVLRMIWNLMKTSNVLQAVAIRSKY
jgi:hypothetical protein